MRDGNAALFNADWKFLLGDPEGAQREDYPDRTWKPVDLPHDWLISEPFDQGGPDEPGEQAMQGYFAWKGVGWYRKTFVLPLLSNDAPLGAVYLYFGGAYRNSRVFVNGREAGGWASGYTSFELDVSALVRPGQNTVAVRLDNGCESPDRWYSGAGLYRNVYLRCVPALHVKNAGVHIRVTPPAADTIAAVTVETTVVNRGKEAQGRIFLQLVSPEGECAAQSSLPFHLQADEETTVTMRLLLERPLLWSADSPHCYRAVVGLTDGKGVDVGKPVETIFGVRTIEIAHRRRMRVNGEPVKLKGVCLHHDCGPLGAAYYDAAWRRRLYTLKHIGCNALRTSHNPPAEEFLELCDELGFYVIDECFDKWRSGYYGAHFDADWRRDLEAFILRDRNHPSVFLWSIGNEVAEQGAGTLPDTARMLAAFVRTLDDRPLTCALHPHVIPRTLVGAPVNRLAAVTKELTESFDVVGVNYQEPYYEAYTEVIDKPIIGTECYEYYSATAENYEDVVPENPWRFVLANDNVIGQFIWAGIDYLGECSWPAKGWAGAILDICGFLKPNAYYRQSIWSEEPVVYLGFYDHGETPDYARGRWSFPRTYAHLNLDHLHRRTVRAAVYTNCEQVELKINGKKRGTRRPAEFENGIIEWTFDYESGEVEAAGYRGGQVVCRHILRTAGPARHIALAADRTVLEAGSLELAHITLTITDEKGVSCPTGEHLAALSLRGDGTLLGACSPSLNAPLGFCLPRVYTSGGQALAIVKAGASPGILEFRAYAENLSSAAIKLTVVKAAAENPQ
jgi:beta-galactosidase